jgi:hypothetical protein
MINIIASHFQAQKDIISMEFEVDPWKSAEQIVNSLASGAYRLLISSTMRGKLQFNSLIAFPADECHQG